MKNRKSMNPGTRRGFLGSAAIGSVAAVGSAAVVPQQAFAGPTDLPLDPAIYGATKLLTSRTKISGTTTRQAFGLVNIPSRYLLGQTIIRVHATIRYQNKSEAQSSFSVQHGPEGNRDPNNPSCIGFGIGQAPPPGGVLVVRGEISMSTPNSQVVYGYNSYTGLGSVGGGWESSFDYQNQGMDLLFSGQLGDAGGSMELMSALVEIFKDYPGQAR